MSDSLQCYSMTNTIMLTSLPVWVMAVLALLMVPRTLLNDLGLISEGTILYYFFALIPYVIWLCVAFFYKSKRPFMDFLLLGVFYGLTLIAIHQLLWNPGAPVGYHPPQAALTFGAQFGAGFQELGARLYTVIVSLIIGVGSGAVFGSVAFLAKWFRARRRIN
jgi:hypothetical protein